MKNFTILVVALLFSSAVAFSTTWTIDATGTFGSYMYSPSAITITSGDTVVFTLASVHSALEVSQASWNAQTVTALPGGFHVPFGGGTLLTAGLSVGTHYFLCENHGPMGMKGTINILSSGINQLSANDNALKVYPNPSIDKIRISYHVDHSAKVDIKLYNMVGKMAAQVLSTTEATGDYIVNYDIDRTRISSGIYLLNLTVDNKRSVLKLVVQ